MDKSSHQVSFYRGTRWEDTTTLCPNCGNGLLRVDKLGGEPTLYVCSKCGYETRKESIE